MILIVGGAGYIGSHINKILSKKGYRTLVLDNLKTGYEDFVKWGNFILGDLNNPEQIDLIFQKYPIRAVMHFAASSLVGESSKNPLLYYRNNVSNTLNLLEAMIKHKIQYFIFSSSCAIYGNPEYLPIDENHKKQPVNTYGKTKWMIEQMLEDFSRAYGLKYISLRYFNASGADPDLEIGENHQPETHLIPLVLDCAADTSKTVSIFGIDYPTMDGTCIRDYIHVNDLANAHILSLEYLFSYNKSDVFNLGYGSGFSVKQIIEECLKVTQRKISYVEEKRREGDPASLIGSNDKIKKILGWQPVYNDIYFIIKTAWDWHQKQISNRKSE